MIITSRNILFVTLASLLSVECATAKTPPQEPVYSPYVSQSFPQTVYWGDTHLHTHLSFDANLLGNTDITPEIAYETAKGKVVTTSTGQKFRLKEPLDFLVIADHGEYVGVMSGLREDDHRLLSQPEGQRLRKLLDAYSGKTDSRLIMQTKTPKGQKPLVTRPIEIDTWKAVAHMADRYNNPGTFTAFVAYEWTSTTDGNNLHRNVIFKDGADKALQIRPFTASDSDDPEDLWAFLDDYERTTGGHVLAIPHNGNGSNGLMFSDKTLSGEPLTRDYAETRARWEPLYEATQLKGDGESHPYLSPNDEFANFENWDWANIAGIVKKEPWMLAHEYVRSALKAGLKLESELGVNPYKFGLVGGTDAHNGLPAIEENNMMGKFAADGPSPTRLEGIKTMVSVTIPIAKYNAAGYTGVWATENTRESLFDAMQRRETYATTGPRMMVRFFGGWDFDPQDHLRPDYAARGYAKGVPMGGDLTHAPAGQAPAFLIVASKAAEGAHLDRIQMVKGWLNADGTTEEKVYNVAVSNGRTIHDNEVIPVQSTVDIKTATYTNTVGDPQLSTVWIDPDFNPEQRAFYYVRVLEIPTPRWTTYDAAFYNTPLPSMVPAVIQERAYTSPIWYTP